MKNKSWWIDILIFNFFIVACLGLTLRSKILFSIPFIDFNRLLDAHFHFAFGGWVTLALTILLITDVLPAPVNTKPVYKWIPAGILSAAWLLLISSPLAANSVGASLCSTAFILVTYVFAWFFIPDIRKAPISKTVKLLGISSMLCLITSSFGAFGLAYLFAVKSLNPLAYRDALYTYLHFQYNGFFTLAVFAILFNRIEPKLTAQVKQRAFQFSVWLCISTLPSVFLTYMWQNPKEIYRFIAICGSVSLLITFLLFVRLAFSLRGSYSYVAPLVRTMIDMSLLAFALKIFLQGFTLFPIVGNAVFGDRPVIIGFLHLVFLGFVTLFLMAWFAEDGFLNIKLTFTKLALIVFTAAIILNEAVLMTQGLGDMFLKTSNIFPWLLWGVSICLLAGALLIGIARIKTKRGALYSGAPQN